MIQKDIMIQKVYYYKKRSHFFTFLILNLFTKKYLLDMCGV
ncbi:MAG: hypothetical protein BAJALOKI1v1_560006 [Promethearchaeota archaeon]|nr:MAG: hypothetical protein BAJALOKI1v1_560006 [Candidatus Lokiarchaeota archaeon]